MNNAITLRFVTGDDVVSAGIRFAQYGFWASHVEAVMPDGAYLGAHFDGGMVARPPGYDAASLRREEFVTLPASTPQADAFHLFMQGQIGKPYDVEAIEAFVAHRDWTQPDRWFCSEVIACGLITCSWFGAELSTKINKIMPRDLRLMVSACAARLS